MTNIAFLSRTHTRELDIATDRDQSELKNRFFAVNPKDRWTETDAKFRGPHADSFSQKVMAQLMDNNE